MNEHGVPDYATQNEHNNLRADVRELDGKVDQLANNTYLGIESIHKRMNEIARPPAWFRILDTKAGRVMAVSLISSTSAVIVAVVSH